MSLLTPTQIAALTTAYKIYKTKKKIERGIVEKIFWLATGKKLGNIYHSIPIVRRLMDLIN